MFSVISSSENFSPLSMLCDYRSSFCSISDANILHCKLKNSDISASLSPAFYYNTFSSFDVGTQHSKPDQNEIAFSDGMSYVHPQKLTANSDLSIVKKSYCEN